MSRLRSSDRELSPEKTAAVLDGALQEFLAHGYAAARIDRIVAAAGVSKATVYRHFADKEHLFMALMQRLASRKKLFWDESIERFEEEPTTFLRHCALTMLENVADDPQVLAFFRIILGESGRFPQLAQAFLTNIEKPGLDCLTQYFQAHPELQLPDPEVAARMFIGTLTHFVVTRDILHGRQIIPIDRDRLLDNLIATLVRPASSASA